MCHLQSHGGRRSLHSFPTRRSSDLASKAWVHALGRVGVLTPSEETQLLEGLDRVAERLADGAAVRSEEHTSELQSLTNLVCRLLLEKKNTKLAIDATH